MKKKICTLLLAFTLCINFCACENNSNDTKVNHIGIDAKTIAFSTLTDMEDYSDVIVKVIKTGEDEPVVNTADGKVVSCYTLSDVKILEIYKNNDENFSQKDTIKIFENEAFIKEENAVYHIAGYEKMKANEEYLLFLRKSTTDNCYIPCGVVFGKIELNPNYKPVQYFNDDNELVGKYDNLVSIKEEAKSNYIK